MKAKQSALRDAADAGPPPAELFGVVPGAPTEPFAAEPPAEPAPEELDAGPPAPELVAAMEREPESGEEESGESGTPEEQAATVWDAGAPPAELREHASRSAPGDSPPGTASPGGGCVACG